jgi:hypothetical protein
LGSRPNEWPARAQAVTHKNSGPFHSRDMSRAVVCRGPEQHLDSTPLAAFEDRGSRHRSVQPCSDAAVRSDHIRSAASVGCCAWRRYFRDLLARWPDSAAFPHGRDLCPQGITLSCYPDAARSACAAAAGQASGGTTNRTRSSRSAIVRRTVLMFMYLNQATRTFRPQTVSWRGRLPKASAQQGAVVSEAGQRKLVRQVLTGRCRAHCRRLYRRRPLEVARSVMG